jgi:hypothetical protein
MMCKPSPSTIKATSRPIGQLGGAKITPATDNSNLQYPNNEAFDFFGVMKHMARDAIEFCDMLNDQVAAASPLRTIQVNQALQMTQHALGNEFQGTQSQFLSIQIAFFQRPQFLLVLKLSSF